MKNYSRCVMQMAMVVWMTGTIMAAQSYTLIVQKTAKLKPVATAQPTVPANAKGTAVCREVTEIRGTTTKTLTVTVSGLTEAPDGTSATLAINGKILQGKANREFYTTLKNGSATFKVNFLKVENIEDVVTGDELEVRIDVGSDVVLTGKFGKETTNYN